jgi:hypothetical protein
MPLTSFRAAIDAPAALVWEMMVEKVERPDLYVPGVRRVEIVRRLGPTTVERRMGVGPPGAERDVHELITYDAATMTVVFKLLDDPKYTGFVTNTVFAEGTGTTLDYTMNWQARGEEAGGADWAAVIRQAVLHAKSLAEARARRT